MPSPAPDEAVRAIAARVKDADPGATLTGRAPIDKTLVMPRVAAALTVPPLPHLPVAEPSADPEGRFPSAQELRRALAAFRRHRGSIALSDEAGARLAELRALGSSGNERRVHALPTECRFGFTQALRSWPENEAARAGLAATLVQMIEPEIAQRDAEGARALYAELGEPRPDLLARIEALAADLAAAGEREARLRALERDRDLTIGGRAQLSVLATLPLFAGRDGRLRSLLTRSVGYGVLLGTTWSSSKRGPPGPQTGLPPRRGGIPPAIWPDLSSCSPPTSCRARLRRRCTKR